MLSILKIAVPPHTMLGQYLDNGAYADCYTTDVAGRISFPAFIFAFYTTLPFRLERTILTLTVSKPSTDKEARQLADGTAQKFAAWHMENRNQNELLMCDFGGRTRSWFMTEPVGTVTDTRTRLYFGSAVVPSRTTKTGSSSLGFGFQSLLGFHKLYSRVLLYCAKRNLERQHPERIS